MNLISISEIKDQFHNMFHDQCKNHFSEQGFSIVLKNVFEPVYAQAYHFEIHVSCGTYVYHQAFFLY